MSRDGTEIVWFGHSCVQIAVHDTIIWIDPFFTGNPDAPDWHSLTPPDLVLLTHDHGDHLGNTLEIAAQTKASFGAIADISGWLRGQGVPAERLLGSAGYNIGGAVEFHHNRIHVTAAVHSSEHGVPVGYVLELSNGLTLYHAGDTALFSDMALIGEMFSLDVAFLPIGGLFTMDGEAAARACALLKTKVVVPIHYATFPLLAQDTVLLEKSLRRFAPDVKMIELRRNTAITL